MANRAKEDERNERTIRNLLKLADNRRCIDCNSLGPQYVCTSFWTFVCTNCSGIQMKIVYFELHAVGNSHTVKSVSMAKFSSQEVTALQEGGNARAKVIYFKECDPQRHYINNASNVERLRDFIKHVYVDRRYTGEKSFDKPPRAKMGETEDTHESRRTDTYQGGPRSPPYEDTYKRSYTDRPSPGRRSDETNYRNGNEERKSPGYDQESWQYGDSRRSPANAKVVNDWRREDRFGNGRRSDNGRISDRSYKLEGRSPDRQMNLRSSSLPLVRAVREILRDNVSTLQIIEPPEANGGRTTDGTVTTQRSASSSSLASSNGNPAEHRGEHSETLIDFDAVLEPPTTEIQQIQPAAVTHSIAQPATSSRADNRAAFDSLPEVKVPQAPANANSLEAVLLQLSVSSSVPTQTNGISGSGGFPTTAPPASTSALPSAANSPKPAPEVTSAAMEVKPNGRKALPEDLFTATYPSYAMGPAGWQNHPPYGLFNMQYNTAMPIPTYPQLSKSINPFDVTNEISTIQAPMFPSVVSLQGAQQNAAPPAGNIHSPNHGTHSPSMMPSLSSYPSVMPTHAPTFAQVVPPASAYMGQQVPCSFPPRQQGVVGFSNDAATFGSSFLNQQVGGKYSAPANGNPFG